MHLLRPRGEKEGALKKVGGGQNLNSHLNLGFLGEDAKRGGEKGGGLRKFFRKWGAELLENSYSSCCWEVPRNNNNKEPRCIFQPEDVGEITAPSLRPPI